MAENPRQEITLSLGGKDFAVRPTFEVIAGIEAALDQPARTVGMKALASGMTLGERQARGAGAEISMSEMAVVLFHMVKGKKDAPANPTEVGNILMEDGYGDLLLPVGQFLTRAQRGNKEHEKEAAAAEGAADPPKQD